MPFVCTWHAPSFATRRTGVHCVTDSLGMLGQLLPTESRCRADSLVITDCISCTGVLRLLWQYIPQLQHRPKSCCAGHAHASSSFKTSSALLEKAWPTHPSCLADSRGYRVPHVGSTAPSSNANGSSALRSCCSFWLWPFTMGQTKWEGMYIWRRIGYAGKKDEAGPRV